MHVRAILIPALLSGLLASSAFAADTATAKPGLSASRTITAAAEVVAIDHATRKVTLKTEDGSSLEFTVGADVRNLGQVAAGDYVIAEIYQSVDIQVKANPDGQEPGVGAATEATRAEPGAMPGVTVADAIVVTAVVTAIDLEANTFTLRGPQGNSMSFEAMNPENLKRAAVGDLVVVTYTESLGVLVRRPAGN